MNLNDGFQLLAAEKDGVARLRELILRLAMQGALVPQDPADESAALMLKRIGESKEHLIREGKIRRDKVTPSDADARLPFEIPQQWEWVRLSDIGQIIGGGTPKSGNPEFWADGDVPWVTPADLYGFKDKRIGSGRRNISRQGLANSSAQLLPAGTVLFSSRAPIGYVAIAKNELATNQGFKSVVPYLDGLSEFVFWFLKSAAKEIDAAASGTTFKEISGADFGRIRIPLPPLAEQARIVAKVDELMSLCDELEVRGRLEGKKHAQLTATLFDSLAASESPHALAENWSRIVEHFELLLDRPEAVDAFEQTILQLAVRGLLVPQHANDEPASELLRKIRLQKDRLIEEGKIKRDRPAEPIADDEKPFEVPAGWTWARTPQIAESRLGKMLDKAKNTGALYPYLRNTNVQWNRFELDDIKTIRLEDYELDEYRLRSGDLMICEGGEPGRCAIWREEASDMYFQKALHRVRALGGVSPEYLAICLESDANSLRLEQYFTGATIKHFAGQELSRYCVPLPPVAEQLRIVARVGELRLLCGALRERLGARQACQARFAETLVEQTTSTAPLVENTDDLAAVA